MCYKIGHRMKEQERYPPIHQTAPTVQQKEGTEWQMSVSAALGSLVLQFSTRGKGTGDDWTQEQASLLGALLATLSFSRKTLSVSCFPLSPPRT